MVDFPCFEAHPVDLPDAAEMPPHADAGERLCGAEIRFRGEVRGPKSVAFDSRGRGPYTGVVDGRVLVFFPSTTQDEFGRHQIMEMTGLQRSTPSHASKIPLPSLSAGRRSSSVIYNELVSTSAFRTPANGTGGVLKALQERYSSSYVGSFASRLRDFDMPSDASLLKEIYRSNPERVVQIFESQPSLHNNSSALSQYVKALVALDRLDESPLLKTLQRGLTRLVWSFWIDDKAGVSA
ncbi:FtsH4 [Hordeum vulgare]|nr:FtsH4 [Hordeum vulgare]